MASKNFVVRKGLTVGDSDLNVSSNRTSVKNLTVGNIDFPSALGGNDQVLRVSGGALGFGSLSADAVIGNAGFDSDQIVAIMSENNARVDSDLIVSLVNENISDGSITGGHGTIGFDSDQVITIIQENTSLQMTTFVYTATAGQTTFTGNDDNGSSLSYNVGKIQVFLNGIRLFGNDFTASNGTSIVLSEPAAVDNQLIIDTFSLNINI